MLASAAFGATVSCQATSATSVAVAGSQNAGVPIPVAGGGTPDDFATLNGEPSPGCSTVDLAFSNFTATVSTITGSANAGTYISTLADQNLATGAEQAIFANVRGADTQAPAIAPDGDNNDGTNDWFQVRKGATVTMVTDYQVVSSGLGIQFFSLGLQGVVVGQGAGGATGGTVSLCLGGTWSSGGTGATCSSGNTSVITLASGTDNYSLNLGAFYTTIGVQNNFTLIPGNSNNSPTAANTYLTSFDESFADSPEPATFGLIGAALAVLGVVGYRRRKLNS